ncbi:hypothetical protein [Stenomitos frigidus]|uniref:hypothetical protein n=1 Tax=Stenomitos frigidus TaxID=1886765 RepID=UPI0015E6CDD3|nr:hypothetical protein [Stenomitos frigidus]
MSPHARTRSRKSPQKPGFFKKPGFSQGATVKVLIDVDGCIAIAPHASARSLNP